MLPHKILQEWLTLDEAAEVIRQHNITLLPADLIRHALHGDLLLSVYFPSPVLLKPLNPPYRFAWRFSKPQLDDEILEHSYKLLNIFETSSRYWRPIRALRTQTY
ncbi:hypothetical protein CGN00_09765 [Salmonella enterica]|nr:hypothetical protein [Salmonella enterica]ECH9065739.1 hypothetical protein [Salmonella enterica subsp. enterica]EAA2620196.1 hypothetical protein [Salmonella enterica]EAM3233368.1 hypothetical protein [Salmonella enterica]EAS2275169.1 hypothetical protein [Salmonella enterica]